MVRASESTGQLAVLGPNAAAEDDSNGFGNGFSKALKRRFYKIVFFSEARLQTGGRRPGSQS
jgi:hypothetical protein